MWAGLSDKLVYFLFRSNGFARIFVFISLRVLCRGAIALFLNVFQPKLSLDECVGHGPVERGFGGEVGAAKPLCT